MKVQVNNKVLKILIDIDKLFNGLFHCNETYV